MAKDSRSKGKTSAASRKAEEAKQAELPRLAHLKVTRGRSSLRMRFSLTKQMTLGSATRTSNCLHTVRSRLKKHRLQFTEAEDHIETEFALAEYARFFDVMRVLDAEIQSCVSANLTPAEVEEVTGISSRERLKWVKDGRLKTSGTSSFKKNGFMVTFFVHAVDDVRKLSPAIIRKWREEDAAETKRARRAGAVKAVKTRERNDETRRLVRSQIDATARDAALKVRNPVAVPVVKLAILTTMCSRWAKRRDSARDDRGRDAFYSLKDRALRTLVRQPWASVAFVPGGQGRHDVRLCEEHRDDFRECRSLGWDFWTWVDDNVATIRRCRHCSLKTDDDYYSLYEIRLAVGDASFCWHVPYHRGRSWLPGKEVLERQAERSDGNGIVLFGRAATDEEVVVWKPEKVREETERLLALLESAQTHGTTGVSATAGKAGHVG